MLGPAPAAAGPGASTARTRTTPRSARRPRSRATSSSPLRGLSRLGRASRAVEYNVRIARFSRDDTVAYGVVQGRPGRRRVRRDRPGHRRADHRQAAGPPVRGRHRQRPLHRAELSGRRRPAARPGPADQGRRHRQELRRARQGDGRRPPDEPVMFLKPSTSVIGPGEAVGLPGQAVRAGRLRGRAGGGHRPACRDVPPERVSEVTRLHLRQRRDRAGPAGQGRAVDPGQGLRQVLPARPVDRDRPGPVRPAS